MPDKKYENQEKDSRSWFKRVFSRPKTHLGLQIGAGALIAGGLLLGGVGIPLIAIGVGISAFSAGAYLVSTGFHLKKRRELSQFNKPETEDRDVRDEMDRAKKGATLGRGMVTSFKDQQNQVQAQINPSDKQNKSPRLHDSVSNIALNLGISLKTDPQRWEEIREGKNEIRKTLQGVDEAINKIQARQGQGAAPTKSDNDTEGEGEGEGKKDSGGKGWTAGRTPGGR